MKIFISYAHVDKERVKRLVVELLQSKGYDIWFDEFLIAGQPWKDQLSEKIKSSEAFVYAMSPDSLESDWCKWELAQAVALGKTIIPIRLDAVLDVPDYLSEIQQVDFSNGPDLNAVINLIKGLNYVRTEAMPSTTAEPQGPPPQASEKPMTNSKDTDTSKRNLIQIAGLVLALISTVVAVSTLPFFPWNNPSPETTALPTPATPAIEALLDLDIRSGPGADFERVSVLLASSSLDIIGISADRLWYQVLLRDGTTGWVLASGTGGRFMGNRAILQVIIPTNTPTPTPTDTPTITPSPTPTNTPTITPSPTATQTPSNTPLPTNTPRPTNTPSPTHTPTDTETPLPPTDTPTPTNTSPVPTNTPRPTNTAIPVVAYPCDGQITGVSGLLNQVHVQPSENSPSRPPVSRASTVNILGETSDFGERWYEIEYDNGNTRGWIPETYVVPSQNCP